VAPYAAVHMEEVGNKVEIWTFWWKPHYNHYPRTIMHG